MLRAGAQVICRWEDQAENFRCEAFNGLALMNPALVIIAHCGSPAAQGSARTIRDALVGELVALGATAITPACGSGGWGDLTKCHALNEPQCQKLLVMVGDGDTRFKDSPDLQRWHSGDATFFALPVLPEVALLPVGRLRSALVRLSNLIFRKTSQQQAMRRSVGRLLPAWVTALNVVFWKASPREAVPAMLALSNMTAVVPKIFVSYRQTESAALAIQLFDALSHAGFDVFLDHFRIPPGVNFQSRLTQELGDKSMVLFLESATFNDSEWVTYEVNVAKACGLGVYALNLCNAPEAPGVDDGLRMWLTDANFVGGKFYAGAELDLTTTQAVLATVRTEHDRAIVRRRQILEQALEGALLCEGGNLPVRCGNGCLQVDSVRAPGTRYIVALTPRPPDLPDFHRVHEQVVQPAKGIVVGLSRLMEPTRVQRLAWLSGVSNLTLKDEGEMLDLARLLVTGAL